MLGLTTMVGRCRRYGRLLSRYATHGSLPALIRSRVPFAGPDPVAPRIVGIELTNACNLKCVYCDAQHPKTMRRRGFMEESTLCNVLSQVRTLGVQTLRFIGAGEPTVHPRFEEFIRKAAQIAPVVSVTTNGQLLDHDICTALCESTDIVEISVDSDNEKTYEESRVGGRFAVLLRNVELLRSVARSIRSRTLVHVRLMLGPSEEDRARHLVRYWRKRADVVTSQRIYDYHGDGGDAFPVANVGERFRPCTSIFKMVGVNWDGDVPLCDASALQLNCPDGLILGNVNERPLSEIWSCEVLQRYRQGHRLRDYAQAQVCRSCPCVWT